MFRNRPMLAPDQAHCRIGGRRTAALWLLTLWCISSVVSAAGTYDGLTGFTRSALEIRAASGRQWFNIGIADTEARQMQGLMFVEHLPADQGMLFPQQQPRVMTMWMKNTLIPLDMLFIDARGRIICLRERTPPQSLDLITCEAPVKAVLEIGGGEARRRGIKVGDLVVHRTFEQHQ